MVAALDLHKGLAALCTFATVPLSVIFNFSNHNHPSNGWFALRLYPIKLDTLYLDGMLTSM
mgnify:CR=1 FL=1